MMLSLGLIILLGLSLNAVMLKIRIPSLIAYIITGILLGPYVLDLISPDLLNISSDLRRIALIVILLRAGLTLDIKDLKVVGKGAILLSFLPATLEIISVGFLSQIFFDITLIEGFILGSIVAAVSPAVVVPRMIALIEKKKGTNKSIPQMVLAASSIDDIYTIVIFTLLLQIYETNVVNLTNVLLFPVSIILGVIVGVIIGLVLVVLFKKYHMRDTIKVLIIFGVAFIFDFMEQSIGDVVPFSSLLAVITLGLTILKTYPILANRLTSKFSKIWVFSEMILFVLIGALVNISVVSKLGLNSLLLLILAVFVRLIAVFISTSGIGLNKKEKLFTFFAYLPKATVQAAIGAIPLSLGMPGGEIILGVSVLSIFITAPIGAILIDQTQDCLLK
ncbi:MAG: cation:proton antiporter [Candidatus Izemoplasmatales bacterium]